MPDIFIDEDKIKSTPTPPSTPEHAEKPEEKVENKPEVHHKKNEKKFSFSHLVSGYDDTPGSVRFGDQMENEVLLLYLRRHFITNLPWIIIAIALALVPIMIEIAQSLALFQLSFLNDQAKFIVYLFYYFFIISGYVFVNYLTWFYNISLVTNIRVVDIDFSSIVIEDVAATKLSQLEDVSYVQIGILRSIFDYGDVRLQTAGTASNFEFLAVPHPERIIKIINNLIGKNKHA